MKEELHSPGVVLLKDCEGNSMCHSSLNRCFSDPYFKVLAFGPGHQCSSDFQCNSKNCTDSIC